MRAGEPLLPRSTRSRDTDDGSTGGLICTATQHQHSCQRSCGAESRDQTASVGDPQDRRRKTDGAHASAIVAPRHIADTERVWNSKAGHSAAFPLTSAGLPSLTRAGCELALSADAGDSHAGSSHASPRSPPSKTPGSAWTIHPDVSLISSLQGLAPDFAPGRTARGGLANHPRAAGGWRDTLLCADSALTGSAVSLHHREQPCSFAPSCSR